MARRWLYHCEACTGWSLVMDTCDIFFQTSLPAPTNCKEDLLFIEEVDKHTSPKTDPSRWFQIDNGRFRGHVAPCYGTDFTKFVERPALCPGTVIGTKTGIHRFVSVLVNEFYANNQKTKISEVQIPAHNGPMEYMYELSLLHKEVRIL